MRRKESLNNMIACVIGELSYTNNLGCGFTKEKAKLGRDNRVYKSKKVECLNNGMIFDSTKDAMSWCGLTSTSGISNACIGGCKHAGKHPETNEPLKWKYV